MAFITPKSEYDEVKRVIATQFAPEERQEVYDALAPFMEHGSRVPLCILHLVNGDREALTHYVECARQDFRDVIYWAEYPAEAAIDTPAKAEHFQQLLEWLGLPQDEELDRMKQEMLATQRTNSTNSQKPWWRFW